MYISTSTASAAPLGVHQSRRAREACLWFSPTAPRCPPPWRAGPPPRPRALLWPPGSAGWNLRKEGGDKKGSGYITNPTQAKYFNKLLFLQDISFKNKGSYKLTSITRHLNTQTLLPWKSANSTENTLTLCFLFVVYTGLSCIKKKKKKTGWCFCWGQLQQDMTGKARWLTLLVPMLDVSPASDQHGHQLLVPPGAGQRQSSVMVTLRLGGAATRQVSNQHS